MSIHGLGAQIATSHARAQTTSPNETQAVAPGLRKLSGDVAKKAGELDKAIDSAMKADRWDEAVARAEELLALRTSVLGPKHFGTVNAKWQLKALGRVAPMSKDDRVAYQSAKTLSEQAETLGRQGKYADQPLYEKACEIKRRLLSDDHPDTAAILTTWRAILTPRGSTPRPSRCTRKALAIDRRLLSDDHPVTATICNNLASNLADQGKYAAAQPLAEKALEIRRRLLGDNHADIAINYISVAANLKAQGSMRPPSRSTRRRWDLPPSP